MGYCALPGAREGVRIPWTRDPSGRLQSQQKNELRRTTDLPCHASTVQIGAPSGKTLVRSIFHNTGSAKQKKAAIAALKLAPSSRRTVVMADRRLPRIYCLCC